MSSTLVFWDVQHGHATTVTSPNGRIFVVDLGQGSYGSGSTFSPLAFLHNSGIRMSDPSSTSRSPSWRRRLGRFSGVLGYVRRRENASDAI